MDSPIDCWMPKARHEYNTTLVRESNLPDQTLGPGGWLASDCFYNNHAHHVENEEGTGDEEFPQVLPVFSREWFRIFGH